MMETKKQNHAEQNAIGWLETIKEHVSCLTADRERLDELLSEREGFTMDVDANGAPDGPGYANDAEAWAGENPDEAEELADLLSDISVDGEQLDEDAIRERIEESPLSVQVRGGWHSPGDNDGTEAEEYEILLSTGGPALRIVGDLSGGQPTSARLEYQDWGTPWTEHITTGDDHDALLRWVSVFYFGD